MAGFCKGALILPAEQLEQRINTEITKPYVFVSASLIGLHGLFFVNLILYVLFIQCHLFMLSSTFSYCLIFGHTHASFPDH